jgi:hypothetical protein
MLLSMLSMLNWIILETVVVQPKRLVRFDSSNAWKKLLCWRDGRWKNWLASITDYSEFLSLKFLFVSCSDEWKIHFSQTLSALIARGIFVAFFFSGESRFCAFSFPYPLTVRLTDKKSINWFTPRFSLNYRDNPHDCNRFASLGGCQLSLDALTASSAIALGFT